MILALIIIVCLSLIAMLVILYRQISRIEREEIKLPAINDSENLLWRPVDYFTQRFNQSLKKVFKFLSFHFLFYIRESLIFFRHLVTSLERLFSRLLDFAHGTTPVASRKSGAVSFFLEEIKTFQKEVRDGR